MESSKIEFRSDDWVSLFRSCGGHLKSKKGNEEGKSNVFEEQRH